MSSIGGTRIELQVVDSTNKHAAELLSLSQVQHGTVILAHEQTAGRGQRGHTWFSAAGKDLTFSIVLLPDRFRVRDQFLLVAVAALAVSDVVSEVLLETMGLGGGEVKVKWPNDVLVGRDKVAGVLIQTEVMGDRVTSAIVGIGLNVNSSELEAELHATSLRLELGHAVDREALLDRLLGRFGAYWDRWAAGDKGWMTDYTERLYARGRWADLLLDGAAFRARPVDVDASGRLIVEGEDGSVAAYGHDRLRFDAR